MTIEKLVGLVYGWFLTRDGMRGTGSPWKVLPRGHSSIVSGMTGCVYRNITILTIRSADRP